MLCDIKSIYFILFNVFKLLFSFLQYLSKIKILQLERDRGEWDSLAPDARREKESSLQMFGQLGRFHNIMSNETIGTLAFLTSGQWQKCLFITHHINLHSSSVDGSNASK